MTKTAAKCRHDVHVNCSALPRFLCRRTVHDTYIMFHIMWFSTFGMHDVCFQMGNLTFCYSPNNLNHLFVPNSGEVTEIIV